MQFKCSRTSSGVHVQAVIQGEGGGGGGGGGLNKKVGGGVTTEGGWMQEGKGGRFG